MRGRFCVLAAVVTAGIFAPQVLAQQIDNGFFEAGYDGWITNWGKPFMSIQDFNGDGDNELVFEAMLLTNQNEGCLCIQDIPATYFDPWYGLGFSCDFGASNLLTGTYDFKVFPKLEIMDTNTTVIATLSGEWIGVYATASETRVQSAIYYNRSDLSNALKVAGKKISDIDAMRAALFLYRFDNNQGYAAGQGWFDNVRLGCVSKAWDVPGIVNGDFEMDAWVWRERNNISSDANWTIQDIDNDGDKELVFEADELDAQWESVLWVQEMDASVVDLTQDVSLTADIVASNLVHDQRAFQKMEFFIGGAPYSDTLTYVAAASGEGQPDLLAATNDIRRGSKLTMTYSDLTNQLWNNGSHTIDEVTCIRSVLFLMQFTNSAAGSGYAWFDNVSMDFTFKDPPNPSAATAVNGDNIALTWDSSAGKTYTIQWLPEFGSYEWTNIATGIAGGAGSTSYTNPLTGDFGIFRVVEE